MARIHLHVTAEVAEARERMEEVLCALARVDGEVRSCGRADEERVACQRERVVDEERAMLGTVARRVQDTDPHRADLDHVRVGERLERVFGLGQRVDRDRQSVLEGEPAVAET